MKLQYKGYERQKKKRIKCPLKCQNHQWLLSALYHLTLSFYYIILYKIYILKLVVYEIYMLTASSLYFLVQLSWGVFRTSRSRATVLRFFFHFAII